VDAIRIIKQDHRKVESLFEQFETLIGLPGDGRTRLIDEICDELTVHTTVEEQLLYPEARRVLDTDIVDHAEHEHAQADQLINRVRECDPMGSLVDQLMAELKSSVLHHIEEEEVNFLPKMAAACGDDALEMLGQQIEGRKNQLNAMGDGAAATGSVPETFIDLTKQELYTKAQEAGISGRSKMTKSELAEALSTTR
jgi:hemerythrin superfamily protein